MASMQWSAEMATIIHPYYRDQDSNNVNDKDKEEKKMECKSYDVQWMSTREKHCFAVVYVNGERELVEDRYTHTHAHANADTEISKAAVEIAKIPAYAIQRYDDTVDENGRGDSDRPEAHHALKDRFVGNANNAGHKRPIGFFRKIPSTRGFQVSFSVSVKC